MKLIMFVYGTPLYGHLGEWGVGGGRGRRPHFITSKPLMIRSQKLHRIIYSSFSYVIMT